jgi:hypothetical protein
MDATRYLIVSGIQRMKQVPYEADGHEGDPEVMSEMSWMAG